MAPKDNRSCDIKKNVISLKSQLFGQFETESQTRARKIISLSRTPKFVVCVTAFCLRYIFFPFKGCRNKAKKLHLNNLFSGTASTFHKDIFRIDLDHYLKIYRMFVCEGL